jgi:glycosyltransferase involved in cell wall biosynthesis
MLNHYKSRFPECNFVLYDNYSTDKTNEIAKNNGCEIIMYDTNNQVDDQKLTHLKNNCWKNAKTDWVLVCDVDELLEINADNLKKEEEKNVTIINSIAYNMVNMEDNFDFANIKYGSRCPPYDKRLLFNKKFIQEINYCPGGHMCSPIGVAKYSDSEYTLYHHNGYNIEYLIFRHLETAKRLSALNKRNGWGFQYLDPPEKKREMMLGARGYVTKIIP